MLGREQQGVVIGRVCQGLHGAQTPTDSTCRKYSLRSGPSQTQTFNSRFLS